MTEASEPASSRQLTSDEPSETETYAYFLTPLPGSQQVGSEAVTLAWLLACVLAPAPQVGAPQPPLRVEAL